MSDPTPIHPGASDPHGNPSVPPEPALGPAAAHLAAAEDAARRADFGTAVRERYRAVTRGLEQRGILEVQRSRTARETADAATTVVPDAGELPWAAHSFDEIVYGGRSADEAEYRRLEQADRYSVAPPPRDAPAEIAEQKRKARRKKSARNKNRTRPELPALLYDWRFWAVVGGLLALFALLWLLTHLGAPPPVHKPDVPPPDVPDKPDVPPPNFGAGQDSIFQTLPGWLAFGGLQALIAWAIVLCWRGRRRGALVGESRPVEAPADELLTGQAGLYRKSRDHDHVAGVLRTSTLRRLRPALGATADTPPESVIHAIAARTGADPAVIRAGLYDPVPDRDTLEIVAAQLEWIEAEVL
ncbi:DUF4129 domain-containing protein [Nocardia jejuensis]|uniref:DUF4129 domain-containing protein n=1 Tax=Nocardia jejuensis TaxID=328049 RepID=UPI00083172A4|nr:DUF4129 domain-containing protein [Nocardia jejuensis]